MYGKRVTIDEVVDLLDEASKTAGDTASRQNADRLLDKMGKREWVLKAGPHQGGFGGRWGGPDGSWHITLGAGGDYHLRLTAKGRLVQITGAGMAATQPWSAPGAAPRVVGQPGLNGAKNRARLRGRSGGFVQLDALRVVGKQIAKIGAGIAVNLICQEIMNDYNQEQTEKEMKRWELNVTIRINHQLLEAMEIRSRGGHAWANVTWTLSMMERIDGDGENIGPQQTFMGVELNSVEVSDKKEEDPGMPRRKTLPGGLVTLIDQQFTVSTPINFDEDEVDYYLELKEQVERYDKLLNRPLLSAEYQLQLTTEKIEVLRELGEFMASLIDGTAIVPPRAINPTDLWVWDPQPFDPQTILPPGWTLPPPPPPPPAPKPRPAAPPPPPIHPRNEDGTQSFGPAEGVSHLVKAPWSQRQGVEEIGPDK
jgi:hypothetical protein